MPKAIFTAALTGGIHTLTKSPCLSIMSDQLAKHAIAAYEVGAAVAHVGLGNPETGAPTPDLELFGKVLTKVKSKCDIIFCTTTSGGLWPDSRTARSRHSEI